MKKLFLSALVCALSLIGSVGHAQLTTVTASNLTIGSTPIATGQVCAVPVDANDNPVTVAVDGGGMWGAGSSCANVSAGAITTALGGGTYQLPDSVLAGNAGFNYTFTVSDTTRKLAFTLRQVPGVAGGTFALDHYFPVITVPTVNALTFTTGSGAPTSACVVKSLYQDISVADSPTLYQCGADHAFHLVAVGGSGSIATTTQVLKGNGAGAGIAATPGTDFATPSQVTAAQAAAIAASDPVGSATTAVAAIPQASSSAFGLVKCGSGTTCAAGVISAAGGSGSVPTGTGFTHVTSGTQDGTAHALVAGDIPALAYDASGAAAAATSTAAQKANNLSDLSSVSSARTNLGLGTAAVTASTAYDASGAATTAQAAAIAASVSKAGSTMTGLLVLSADPTASLGAATKQYVDSHAGSGGAASGANSDITSLSGLTTPLSAAQGGTGVATLTGLRKANGTGPDTAAVPGTDYVAIDSVNNSQLTWQAGSGGDSSCTLSTAGTSKTCFFAATGFMEESDNGGAYYVQVDKVVGSSSVTVTPGTGANANTVTLTATGGGSSGPSAFTALTDAGTVTLATAGAAQSNATLTMAHATTTRTLNVTGLASGSFITLEAIQDSTGGAALVLGSGCTWQNVEGGTTASVASAASAVTTYTVFYDGTNCYFVQKFAKTSVVGDIPSYTNVNGVTGDSGTLLSNLQLAAGPFNVTTSTATAVAYRFNNSATDGFFSLAAHTVQLELGSGIEAFNWQATGQFNKTLPLCWGSTNTACSLGLAISTSNSYANFTGSATTGLAPGAAVAATFDFLPIQTIASATTIPASGAITTAILNVSGTAAIATITPPAGVTTTLGTYLDIMPTGAFTFTTGGNISNPTGVTPVVGTPIHLVWFGTAWAVK